MKCHRCQKPLDGEYVTGSVTETREDFRGQKVSSTIAPLCEDCMMDLIDTLDNWVKSGKQNVYMTATQAAEALGVSRMRVNQLLNDGKLDGFKHDGTWSVYKESVESRIASQSKRLFQQHELDAFLGGFADDFDVDAIIEESTEILGGNRYWKDDVDLGEICARHDKSI